MGKHSCLMLFVILHSDHAAAADMNVLPVHFYITGLTHFVVMHALFLSSSEWRAALLSGWSSGCSTPCSGSAGKVRGRPRLCC